MTFRSRIATWASGLQEKAASLHPRARITGVIDYFCPFLDDEVGEVVGCWRLSGERDRDYQHRLAVHISEKIAALEALEQRLLDHDRRTAP